MNKYVADAATFPRDARVAWRSDGARGLWAEIAERTVYRVARTAHYDLYERDLATSGRVAPPAGLEVRRLDREELELLHVLMTSHRRAHLARDTAHCTMFAAFRGEHIVGYSWCTTNFGSILDFSPLTLPPDSIFHGYVHVARDERHRGTASALFSESDRFFYEQGVRAIWYLLNPTNVRGARAASGRSSGHIRHIARLSYRKLPFHTSRTLTVTEPA